jgi:RHS repeat-associated protein
MEPMFSTITRLERDQKKRFCISSRGSRSPFAQILFAVILLFLSTGIAGAQTNLPDKYGVPYGYYTQVEALQGCQRILAGYVIPLNSYGAASSGSVKTPCTFYLGNPGTYGYTYCAEYNYVVVDRGSGYTGFCVGWNAGLQSMQPAKNLGSTCNCAGDPINVETGNEYRDEEDASLGDLSLHRYYNSDASMTSSHVGAHWRHSFDRSLVYQPSTIPATATMVRANGVQKVFNLLGTGQWTPDADVADSLTPQTDASGTITGWIFFDAASRNHENYDANGNLVSTTDSSGQVTTLSYSASSTPTNVAPAAGLLLTVTDPHGRSLSFTYNAQSNVATATLPDGGQLAYSYDTNGNLVKVTYPDSSAKQYLYNESALNSGTSQPNALTGDIDETNMRFSSVGYDAQGRAILSRLGANIEQTQVSYSSSGGPTVTYATGAQATFGSTVINDVMLSPSISAACGALCGQSYQSTAFDGNGRPTSRTDFKGNLTKTTFDANGLLNQQIDASGTANQRTTNFTWNTTLRVPLTRVVLDANGNTVGSMQWVYNSTGQTLARCEMDPSNSAATGYICSNTGTVPAGVRRWTYTYCAAVDTTQCPIVGLMLTATGPRTDTTQTTTYSYYLTSSATHCGTPGAACYQAGDLHTITDAAGHVTTIASYDGAGRITRLTDANGINTDLTYTPRGWLASRSVNGQTTTFTYTPYGAVQTVTDADGVTTTYGYDPAHRLTTITDAQGNTVQYTLDAAGNKTAEQVFDASGTLHKSLSRSFNTLGQLTKVMDGLNHTVFDASASNSYDANGNLVQSADGLGIQRQSSYDALNRLVQTLDNYNGTDSATANTRTQYAYDSLDRLTQLTDPSNLATTYAYDGLGNATGQQSPDTGTKSRSFDAAGNVLTRTNAKGITATHTYDALNRLLTVSYPDSTQAITYAYDEANSLTGCTASYPIGRLTRIIEQAVTTVYCYDAHGNVIQKQQITAAGTDTTAYRYTHADRLSGITYPSGTQVSYTRDSNGRIQAITATPPNGTASTVVSNVSYQPFGPVSGYTLGNGQPVTRAYDANYRLTDLTSPAFTLHVARDAMGNITAIGNAPGADPATETYSYDPLYRLTQITEADGSALESVTYNQTGDRLSKTGSGLATGNYSYNPNTHQLMATGNAARSVDANGNTTAVSQAGSVYGFGYNDRNRMAIAQLAGNTVGSYTYNSLNQRVEKVANGATQRFSYNEASQMLAEYGATNRDYIWMDGIPVANVDMSGSTSTIAYVTADQLGTPRAVADSSGGTVWQWPYQGNAWGESVPTSNGYTYNQRFAGQYFDTETGLHQNVNRDYEPPTGRYGQADPLGYLGGQWSLYAYTGGNPLNNFDPLGLATTVVCRPIKDWRVTVVGVLTMTQYVHCAVFVWHLDCNGHRVIDRQYSLAGNRTPFPQGSNAPTAVDDRDAFLNGGNGVSDWHIPPPPGMTSSDFDSAVTDAGNFYNSGQDYDARNGPNSNTATNTIIQNAGGTMPDIPGAVQQHYHNSN